MIEEFLTRINEYYGLFLNARISYNISGSHLNSKIPEEFNEQNIAFGDGDPNDSKTRVHLTVNIGDFKNHIKPNGRDIVAISNLCMVSIYQLWEDEYRGKIAENLKKQKSEITSDIFGDVRILRNAIIHNNGKSTSEFKKIKILKFMQEREIVAFYKQEFHLVIDEIKKNLLSFSEHVV